MGLTGRDLLKPSDLTKAEFLHLLGLAGLLRDEKRRGVELHRMNGANIALLFEKASTRTRSAFEIAAHDQGAHVTYMGPEETHLGQSESMKDTARVLSRMFDGIEFRGFSQDSVETLGRYAAVPVWNGLTDEWHPTQMLGDLLTMRDHTPKALEETCLCFLGDGSNNTANSLLVTAALLGFEARICAPKELWPNEAVRSLAQRLADTTGARLRVDVDVATSVAGADFVYTDVWLSMGEPSDQWGHRIDLLLPYQVNANVMAGTRNPAAKFMHCLPALHDTETAIGRQIHDQRGIRALEVTNEVFESEASIVFDQAENRLHTIKALMVATIGN